MSVDPLVVLDACVLVNFSLCDTLLRLTEAPALYEPKWSAEIMAETVRTLGSKLGWPAALTSYLQSELLSHFAKAWVTGYEPLVSRMTNDEKDRHVLAAAVSCGASIIVTLNLRHFQNAHLEPWGSRSRPSRVVPQHALLSRLGYRHGEVAAADRRPRPQSAGAFEDLAADSSGIRGPDFVHAFNVTCRSAWPCPIGAC